VPRLGVRRPEEVAGLFLASGLADIPSVPNSIKGLGSR
jgi:hypothetical protein